jgi:hypothetical protein
MDAQNDIETMAQWISIYENPNNPAMFKSMALYAIRSKFVPFYGYNINFHNLRTAQREALEKLRNHDWDGNRA